MESHVINTESDPEHILSTGTMFWLSLEKISTYTAYNREYNIIYNSVFTDIMYSFNSLSKNIWSKEIYRWGLQPGLMGNDILTIYDYKPTF